MHVPTSRTAAKISKQLTINTAECVCKPGNISNLYKNNIFFNNSSDICSYLGYVVAYYMLCFQFCFLFLSFSLPYN